MAGRDNKVFKKRLEQLRNKVQRDSKLTENERKPVTLDQSMVGRLSRMDALQNQAMALEAERRRGVELSALMRLCPGLTGGSSVFVLSVVATLSPSAWITTRRYQYASPALVERIEPARRRSNSVNYRSNERVC